MKVINCGELGTERLNSADICVACMWECSAAPEVVEFFSLAFRIGALSQHLIYLIKTQATFREYREQKLAPILWSQKWQKCD
jgi:hypothetical protein